MNLTAVSDMLLCRAGGVFSDVDLPGIPEADSGGQGAKERLSSAGSGELHGVKNMSLAERNKQAQRRHRQRQRVDNADS